MQTKTIVVGYDGSEPSDRAIEAAISLAGDDATVHVVAAYDAPSARYIASMYASVPAEFTANIDLLAEPRKKAEAAAQRVKDQGINAVEHLIDHDPATAILEVAENVDADLIIVGSRGLGRASQVLRGSVSTRIAHHSPVNFLVVH